MKSLYSLLEQHADDFLTVCQFKSLTISAKALGVSPSAVSQSIRSLEDELGFDLFDRSSRPWVLTPEGRKLQEAMIASHRSLEDVVTGLRLRNNLPAEIRIGIIDSVNAVIGARLVTILHSQTHKIVTVSGTSEILIQQFEKGLVDYLIVSDPISQDESVLRRQLFIEPVVAIYPKETHLRSDCDLRDFVFTGLPLIRAPLHTISGRVLEDVLQEGIGLLPSRVEVDSSSVVLELVAAGVGWSLQYPMVALSRKDLFSKIKLSVVSPNQHREIFLIAKKNTSIQVLDQIQKVVCSLFESLVDQPLKENFNLESTHSLG